MYLKSLIIIIIPATIEGSTFQENMCIDSWGISFGTSKCIGGRVIYVFMAWLLGRLYITDKASWHSGTIEIGREYAFLK